MKILIVSATHKEVELTANFLGLKFENDVKFYSVRFLNSEIFFLITGIGSYTMIYELTKILLTQDFDLAINIGIAGSFQKKLVIGDVVNVISEQIGDLGVDDNGVFKSIFDTSFLTPDTFPFTDKELKNNNTEIIMNCNLPKVKSLSVNTVSGNILHINKLKSYFDVSIENMEGAAFFYVCICQNQPFIEIRAISNIVEPRHKENWNIMLAINNLNNTLRMFMLELMKNK
jgi:futalosine hydrolase